jgi:hypothetical protein
MGDFEDIFGAGENAVDIIDGISNSESRQEHLREIIDHVLWFPDYQAAEAWEKKYPATSFTRRLGQGGFEVTLRDFRSETSRWNDTATASIPNEPVSLLRVDSLATHEVSHGGFTVRLAKDTSTMLTGLLDRLRYEIPAGRAAVSPITLPRVQFNAFFRSMPESVSHEFELGMGAVAIFCEDHRMLVGRRVLRTDLQIWPWIFELDCGGGKPGENTLDGCFLCDHHEMQGYIPSNTHYHVEAFNGSARKDHKHFITKNLYASDVRPKLLAQCVRDWIALLEPFDKQMTNAVRAPSNVIAVRKETGYDRIALNGLCEALACAIALREEIATPVQVSLCATTDLDNLSQTAPERLTLVWKEKAIYDIGFNEISAKASPIAEIVGIDLNGIIPEWRDVVDLYPSERGPESITWYEGSAVAHGSFSFQGLSADEKVAAMLDFETLLASNLPPIIRELLEPTTKS